MCVTYITIYICGDTDTRTVPCPNPGHPARTDQVYNPDVCNRSNCQNPGAHPAPYMTGSHRSSHKGASSKGKKRRI